MVQEGWRAEASSEIVVGAGRRRPKQPKVRRAPSRTSARGGSVQQHCVTSASKSAPTGIAAARRSPLSRRLARRSASYRSHRADSARGRRVMAPRHAPVLSPLWRWALCLGASLGLQAQSSIGRWVAISLSGPCPVAVWSEVGPSSRVGSGYIYVRTESGRCSWASARGSPRLMAFCSRTGPAPRGAHFEFVSRDTRLANPDEPDLAREQCGKMGVVMLSATIYASVLFKKSGTPDRSDAARCSCAPACPTA